MYLYFHEIYLTLSRPFYIDFSTYKFSAYLFLFIIMWISLKKYVFSYVFVLGLLDVWLNHSKYIILKKSMIKIHKKLNIWEGTWYADEMYFLGIYSCMPYFLHIYFFSVIIRNLLHISWKCHWSDKYGSMNGQKYDL